MTHFVRKVKQTAQTLSANQALINQSTGNQPTINWQLTELTSPVDDCTHVNMLANNGLSSCKVYIYFHLDRLIFGGFCSGVPTLLMRINPVIGINTVLMTRMTPTGCLRWIAPMGWHLLDTGFCTNECESKLGKW